MINDDIFNAAQQPGDLSKIQLKIKLGTYGRAGWRCGANVIECANVCRRGEWGKYPIWVLYSGHSIVPLALVVVFAHASKRFLPG